MARNLDWLREFLSASKRDITFILEARDALLTHPRMYERIEDPYAPACRVIIVTGVTAVERSIEAWPDAGAVSTLNDRSTPNAKRVESLLALFDSAEVETDRDLVEDYLAVKYLRNAIVHNELKGEDQRRYIKSRGFPTDIREFGNEHWLRILNAVSGMTRYLLEAYVKTQWAIIPVKDDRASLISDLSLAAGLRHDNRLGPLLVMRSELPRLWWGNLMNVWYWLRREPVLDRNEKSRLVDVALDSWRAYLEDAPYADEMGQQLIKQAIKTLENLHMRGIYPIRLPGIDLREAAFERLKVRKPAYTEVLSRRAISAIERAFATLRDSTGLPENVGGDFRIWSPHIPFPVAKDLLPLVVRLPPHVRPEKVLTALRVGAQMHESLINKGALELFLVQLPPLVPGRRDECLEAGRMALARFRLKVAWYAWVESNDAMPLPLPEEEWRDFEQLAQS